MARDNLRNRTHLPKDIASYERVASATTGDPLGPGTPVHRKRVGGACRAPYLIGFNGNRE